MNIDSIYFVLEIIGTVAFAVTGVITAYDSSLDVLGAVVLGLVTAVGGGILRDIILGYLPPAAFRVPLFSIIAIITSLLAFVIAYYVGKRIKEHFEPWAQIINIFDSIGLAAFTIGGINAAHTCGFAENSFLSIFVGVLTAVGGGVLRDIMAGSVPGILKKRVYAIAAIIGACVYQGLMELTSISNKYAVIISISAIFVIRILATLFNWNLPSVKSNEE
ncbi:MAG: trimeric intracellular cation channel family protein [Clostridia bacterium]|nr:trimeric intracellular cation channel family protein [Clostridia bacterium]